jgi:hypothetical protein
MPEPPLPKHVQGGCHRVYFFDVHVKGIQQQSDGVQAHTSKERQRLLGRHYHVGLVAVERLDD